MKIFEIETDANNVQWVMPRTRVENWLELSTFDCERKNDTFDPIEWYIFNPKKEKQNFFTGVTGALVFDQAVYESELFTLFEMAGEIIPIQMETGDMLYVLNVLECTNVLDHKQTSWSYYDDGSRGRILRFAFHNKGFSESSIFKIPETSRAQILSYSGLKDSDDEFFSLYHKLGFTGLVFEELFIVE